MKRQTTKTNRAGKLLASWRRRVVAPFALALCAAMMLAPVTAHATQPLEIEQKSDCTIEIAYHDLNNDPIAGVSVQVYRVATVTGKTQAGAISGYTAEYKLTSAFKQFDENTGSTKITGFSEEALNEAMRIRDGESAADRRARWQRIAASLEPYVATRVRPAGEATSGVDGIARFANLTPGLYLVLADSPLVEVGPDDYKYYYDPTFVALPAYENGAWDYGIDLNYADNNAQLRPKFRYERVPYEYEVYKRWVGDAANVRPDGITVDIYRDNTLFETVVLNEENGWRYAWTGGRRYNWRVVERTTAQNYTVSVTSSKWTGTITLTNTYNPPPPPYEPPPPPPPPDNPPPPLGARRDPEVLGVRRRGEAVLGARRLPQSGQLWWPVPVLAGVGVVLFLAGVARRRRDV